jgi:phosphatidylserine/phosphatidylglycerophosphate/cardiolipin synthase-like enzyme
MRRHTYKGITAAVLLALFLFARSELTSPLFAPGPAATEDGLSVWFSPQGGCEAAIVHEIAAATISIDIQAYSFTSIPIEHALADAQARGVRVRAVLDKIAAGEHYSGADFLFSHNIPVWLDGNQPIAHNKVIILDGQTVVTGSYNFTKQAETENAENVLIIHGKPAIAAAYAANFQSHLDRSDKYTGIPGRASSASDARGERG